MKSGAGRAKNWRVMRLVTIRREEPDDAGAVREVNVAAFPTPAEADLVDALRADGVELVGFVAEEAGSVVGHLLFSPVRLEATAGTVTGMGLAPMAVSPSHQRQGIGTRLVHVGLSHLQKHGCPFVVVLGHPAYYPRFGFERASLHGVRSQWPGVPDDVFFVRWLQPPPGDTAGVAFYGPRFSI